MDDTQHKTKIKLSILAFVLFSIFILGLFLFAIGPKQAVQDLTGSAAIMLSFISGLTMIFLPCTLPLAFVIVPMTLGKEPKKGLLMALFFTLGVTITLSFYGVFVALAGKAAQAILGVGGGGLTSDAEVYAALLGGIVAFLFGLSEVGILNFKLPSYSGKFPDFIQNQKDYIKTFFLGLFLGNIGVGCPNPAFYLLLGYVGYSADIFNGWYLLFIHGIGRSIPLIFLAILGSIGINALSGVSKHKEGIEKGMGWALIIVGVYLITFGIFGHDWFVASGIHGSWERLISEIGGPAFSEVILKHKHKLIGLPSFVQYGNMFFLALLALVIFIAYILKKLTRKSTITLSVIYILITLLIGSTTNWTFRTDKNVHVEFKNGAATHGSKMETTADDHKIHKSVIHKANDSIKEGVVVNLNIDSTPVKINKITKLDFIVSKMPGNVPAVNDLEISHEKIMHVIGVRDDLNNFFHIHPKLKKEDVLSVSHTFDAPGLYQIWSEVKYRGENHVFAHAIFPVDDDKGKDEKKEEKHKKNIEEDVKKDILFTNSQIVNNYQIILHSKNLAKGVKSQLSFEIKDSSGRDIEFEPYLGEKMHLSIIKDDLEHFIHTHPSSGKAHNSANNNDHHSRTVNIINNAYAHGGVMDEHDENENNDISSEEKGVNFEVVFPEAGIYRAFAEFRPKGEELKPDESIKVAFWLQVKESVNKEIVTSEKSKISKEKAWWINLIWSIIAIIILCFLVKKYITVNKTTISAEEVSKKIKD